MSEAVVCVMLAALALSLMPPAADAQFSEVATVTVSDKGDTGGEAFSPDGSTFVLGVRNGNSYSSSGYIYWYDANGGFSHVGQKQIGDGASLTLQFSNAGDYLAQGNRDEYLYILNVSDSFTVVQRLEEFRRDGDGVSDGDVGVFRGPLLWLKDDQVLVHIADQLESNQRAFYGYNTSNWSLLYKSDLLVAVR